MAALENVSNVSFVNEILYIRDGRKLGKLRPDEDGYYDVPVAVLGKVSDNNTYYDVNSIVAPLTDPNAVITRKLNDGKLFGEFDHPDLKSCKTDIEKLERLVTIDMKSTSHHFKSIYSGEELEAGGRLLNAKMKPEGVYKRELQDFFDNPLVNVSFSLRGICDGKTIGGISKRIIKKLVTFDNVLGGGYFEAAKRYSTAALESLSFNSADLNNIYLSQVAMESFTDTEINEIFGTNKVMRESKSILQIQNTRENRSKVLNALDAVRRY